jgi:hypothetical protein
MRIGGQHGTDASPYHFVVIAYENSHRSLSGLMGHKALTTRTIATRRWHSFGYVSKCGKSSFDQGRLPHTDSLQCVEKGALSGDGFIEARLAYAQK